MHNLIRTLWNNKNLIFFYLSSPLAPSSDHYFFNILAFLVFLIHDSLVLCSATCIVLGCLFWDLFCPFFQSHRASWFFFTLPPPSYSWVIWGFLTTSLSAYAEDLHIYFLFPDLSSLVKIGILERLYDSSPEIAGDSYRYQEFLFSSVELLHLLFHNFF